MTRSKMLETLKNLTGETEEATLRTFLDIAGEAILNRRFPYADDTDDAEVEPRFHAMQVKIAAYLLNKRGAEGQTAHNENGINRTWSGADIPPDMLAGIIPCGRVLG